MHKLLGNKKHNPVNEQFWCNVCDRTIVDSTKPETGDFFVFFGHSYSAQSKSYDGNYTGVMFALCKDCQH
jgi:hypothetical protein